MDTTQLIRSCQTGDPLAIDAFVRAHQGPVYRLALSVLDEAREAEEVAQDALLQALRALGGFRGEANLTTWLYCITLNLCRSRLRQRQTRTRLQTALEGLFHQRHGPPAEAVVAAKETQNAVWQAIQALNEKQRLPIILRYYHDLSIAEIAEVLQVNSGTIHSRLSLARDQLRVALGQHAWPQDDAL